LILLLALTALAGAQCELRSLVTEVDLDTRGASGQWSRVDTWHVGIGTGAVPCRQWVLEDQLGVRVTDVRAVIRQPDDTRIVLGAERLHIESDGGFGTRSVLQMPELRTRDRLMLRITRAPESPTARVRWRPGARGLVQTASLALSGVSSTTSVAAFEDGLSVALPTGQRDARRWHWSLTDVPDGHPEPNGSDWRGAEWWVSVDGTLRDEALIAAREDAVPTWAPPGDVRPVDWLDPPGPPLRVVGFGPNQRVPGDVWANGWGRARDVARTTCSGLQSASIPSTLVHIRLPGSPRWDHAAVVDPYGTVLYATASDRMFGADAIEAGTGAAVALADPPVETRVHMTTVAHSGESWAVVQPSAPGASGPARGVGPIRLSGLMPRLDDRDPSPRLGRLWTGNPRRVLWTLEILGGPVRPLPTPGSGRGPATEWAASCTSDESGARCAVQIDQAGGWIPADAVPALRRVHQAIDTWAQQTLEVVP
jgi:hypothetical protein